MVYEHGHTFWRAPLLWDHGWVCDIVGHGAATSIVETAIAGTASATPPEITPEITPEVTPEVTPETFLTNLNGMV